MPSYEELKKQLEKAIRESNVNEAMRLADALRAASGAKATRMYMVNITDRTIHIATNYRHFWIAGKKPGEEYAVTTIPPVVHDMDIGDRKIIKVEIFAEDIAKDLERMANGDIGEGTSFAGVFACHTQEPSAEELAECRSKYIEACKKWVTEGENTWSKTHDHVHITDYMRRAVKELGLEKDWAYDPKEMVECVGCGEKVRPGVAVCKACGAILDEEKAKKLYPDRFRETEPAVPVSARARRKKEAAGQEI